ncbi:MAG: D-2-hydroxyacid dehydrogenase [Solirubrobacteraceae bacterium]
MKVLANDGISKEGIEAFNKYGFEILTNKVAQEQLANFINENKVEVLLVRSATKVRKELIDQTPGLKVVGRGGVGLDNIDVDYAREKGIQVVNTPAASSQSVAELVFAHLFSLVRFLHDSNRRMPLEGDYKFEELKKNYTNAIELKGKRMGVVGFGRIGEETIKTALSLGLEVLVVDSYVDFKEVNLNFFDGQTISFKINTIPMDKMLAEADFISLHVPAQDGYLIGEKEIQKMKEGVIIINAARGGVVDEIALINSINSGRIRAAALDVFENEPKPEMALLMHDKISLSPHVGGNTIEAQERIGVELADIIAKIYKV